MQISTSHAADNVRITALTANVTVDVFVQIAADRILLYHTAAGHVKFSLPFRLRACVLKCFTSMHTGK